MLPSPSQDGRIIQHARPQVRAGINDQRQEAHPPTHGQLEVRFSQARWVGSGRPSPPEVRFAADSVTVAVRVRPIAAVSAVHRCLQHQLPAPCPHRRTGRPGDRVRFWAFVLSIQFTATVLPGIADRSPQRARASVGRGRPGVGRSCGAREIGKWPGCSGLCLRSRRPSSLTLAGLTGSRTRRSRGAGEGTPDILRGRWEHRAVGAENGHGHWCHGSYRRPYM